MSDGAGVHIRRLLLPVYAPMVLLSVGIAAPLAAFPQYLSSLGASLAVVGIVVSLRGIGNLLIDLPAGVILSRNRLRPVMFICLVIATVSAVGVALTKSIFVISALVLLRGTSTSVVVTAMMTYVRMTVPATARGRALSGAGGSLRLGLLIGPAVGGLIADTLGVPLVFALQALCLALAGLLVLLSPDRGVAAPSADSKPRLRDQATDLKDGLADRWFAVGSVGFSITILQLLRAARTIFLPLWGDAIGLSVTVIGAVISAGAVMDFLLFIPGGQIMDRAGRKVAASICIGLFSLGVLILPLSAGIVGFVAASMLIGFGNGFGAGINMTLGTDLAPGKAVSTFLGAWRLFGDIGQASGPAIVGGIAAATGLSSALFVTAGIGGVGLLVMALFAPETIRIASRGTSTESE